MFDSIDVALYLREGKNIVAIEAFYWNAKQEAVAVGCPPGESAFCVDGRSTDLDPLNFRDVGGVLAWLETGSVGPPLPRTGDADWRVWGDGDLALTVNRGVTNGQYHQPHEFYDMSHYPSGWRSADYVEGSDLYLKF